MNTDEILALYDDEQRRNAVVPGMRREETPEVVRFVSQHDNSSVVLYSDLTAENANRAIAEQIEYFKGLGHEFEWKLFGHDKPRDLRARLAAHGLTGDELEAIIALDLEEIPERLLKPVTIDIRRVADPADLDDLITLEQEVWNEDKSWLRDNLSYELRTTPDDLYVYVAYVDDRPASAAWLRFDPRGRWAGLWGGSTLPAYRQRGVYTALVAQRVQDAQKRGVRFLTVDASPMSRPILEHLGFRQITTSEPFNWSPK